MSVAPSTQTVEADKSRWLRRDSADEPPARLLLSRRRIVVTALALVEEHGLEALTMRRVAAALGVTPMSLYNHVSDKAELIDLMVDFLLGDVVEASIDNERDWTAKLRAVARQTYRVWSAHPGFARVYADGVTVGPNGLANIERLIAVLREAGFDDPDAARAFFLLYHFTIASLLIAPAKPVNARDRATRSDRGRENRVDKYFSALQSQDIPNVVAVANHLSGGDFEFGLDVILAGLAARLAAGNTRPTRARRQTAPRQRR